MPADHDPKLSVRFGPDGRRRLEALAEARGVSLSRCVRQLVDEASVDAPRQPRRHLSEEELLDLLRERAEDGNVGAISRLLEIRLSGRSWASPRTASSGYALLAVRAILTRRVSTRE
jgi:hypothetical protein